MTVLDIPYVPTRDRVAVEKLPGEFYRVKVFYGFMDEPDLPAELGDQLVARAFALPAVRMHRPVLVCIPQRSCGLLARARRHVQDARTRAAGVTCLLEGQVGGQPSATPGSTPLPR